MRGLEVSEDLVMVGSDMPVLSPLPEGIFYTAPMKTNSHKTWNIRRLDVRAFAEAEASWEEQLSLGDLERLAQERCLGDDRPGLVSWHAHGEMRPGTGGAPVVWLHLRANTTVPLSCQRCLGPVDTGLVVDRRFRFVADEATAEAEDDDSDEDVLALEPRPDLLALLEDELLMALPLVPMHVVCPETLPHSAGKIDAGASSNADAPHPFAALSTLKK